MRGLDRWEGGIAVGGIAVFVGVAVGGGLVAVAEGNGVSVGFGVAVSGTTVFVGGTKVGANNAVIVISGVGKTNGSGVAKTGRLQATVIPNIPRMINSKSLRLNFILPPVSLLGRLSNIIFDATIRPVEMEVDEPD
jgi:hypothetical protein